MTSGNLHWGKESQLPASAAGIFGVTLWTLSQAFWVRGRSCPHIPSLAGLSCPAIPSSVWALVLGWPCQPGMVPGVRSAGCPRKISGGPGWGAPWGIPYACSVTTYLCLSSFCSTTEHASPQPPTGRPSESGILFDTLKTSSEPSYKRVRSQDCLTKGHPLGTSPNSPAPSLPRLGRGIQKTEVD